MICAPTHFTDNAAPDWYDKPREHVPHGGPAEAAAAAMLNPDTANPSGPLRWLSPRRAPTQGELTENDPPN